MTAWGMLWLGVLLIAFSFLAQLCLLDPLQLDLTDQLPLAVALLGSVSLIIGFDAWRTHQQWNCVPLPKGNEAEAR